MQDLKYMYTNIDKNSTIIPLYMEAVIKTMNFCLEFLNASFNTFIENIHVLRMSLIKWESCSCIRMYNQCKCRYFHVQNMFVPEWLPR